MEESNVGERGAVRSKVERSAGSEGAVGGGKAKYVTSAKAAGFALDTLVSATYNCADNMPRGLRAMEEDVLLPPGIVTNGDISSYAAFSMSYHDGVVIMRDQFSLRDWDG